jgi:hypothetical protein
MSNDQFLAALIAAPFITIALTFVVADLVEIVWDVFASE